MNISFKTLLQITSDILINKFNKTPLNVAIEEVAKKYNMPEEEVIYICNERKLSY